MNIFDKISELLWFMDETRRLRKRFHKYKRQSKKAIQQLKVHEHDTVRELRQQLQKRNDTNWDNRLLRDRIKELEAELQKWMTHSETMTNHNIKLKAENEQLKTKLEQDAEEYFRLKQQHDLHLEIRTSDHEELIETKKENAQLNRTLKDHDEKWKNCGKEADKLLQENARLRQILNIMRD